MKLHVVLALFLLGVFCLAYPATRAAAEEKPFQFETAPGITAIQIGADIKEPVVGPAGTLLSQIQRLVTTIAIIGSSNGQKHLNIPNLEKQAALKGAITKLYPQALQKRVVEPQQDIGRNRLQPFIAGRACSSKSTTDTSGKALSTVAVGDILPLDYYDMITFTTLLSGISNAIQYHDDNGRYAGNGLPGRDGLNIKTQPQEIWVPKGDQNQLINPEVLYPCGAQSSGQPVPAKSIGVKGDVAAGDSTLNVTVPKERYDISDFIKGLLEAGKCLVTPGTDECQIVLQSLGTSITGSIGLPASVGLSGMTYSLNDADVSRNLYKEARDRLLTYKGWTNTFKPSTISFAKNLTAEDGTTDQSITGVAHASPQNTTTQNTQTPWRGMHGVIHATDMVTDCMLMPSSLQKKDTTNTCTAELAPATAPSATNCNTTLFGQIARSSPTGGGNGGPIGTHAGYTLPYRNTACTISEDKGQAIADLAARWSAKADTAFSQQNILNNWKAVQDNALKYGWNPAFVVALWIEESAAGGVNTWQMGCKYAWNSTGGTQSLPTSTDACTQEACLFSHPGQDPNNFEAFMCSYNTGVCDSLKPGDPWQFAQNIKFAYQLVANIAGLPAECRIRQK